MKNSESALAIAQGVIDRTGLGLMTGDFEVFAPCFCLPQDIETFDGRRHLETLADLRSVFDAVRAFHRKMGVTEMVRHCVTAEYRDPTTISCIHQTRLVRGSLLLQKPYHVFSVLSFENDVWRSALSQYAVDDSPSLCRALVGA